MAVASAVLQHLLQVTKCKTLFITHYPLVAIDLEKQFPADLQNLHMGYTEDLRIDGTRDITFLYRLTRGIAKESFGIECARLAGLPEQILSAATDRSATMQSIAEQRSRQNKYVTAIPPPLSSSLQRLVDTEPENAFISLIDALQGQMKLIVRRTCRPFEIWLIRCRTTFYSSYNYI
jgi:DNA mismatch repair ATPase MutS